MCIRDRSGMNLTKRLLLSLGLTVLVSSFFPVSYTHLDVYKRQRFHSPFFTVGNITPSPSSPSAS